MEAKLGPAAACSVTPARRAQGRWSPATWRAHLNGEMEVLSWGGWQAWQGVGKGRGLSWVRFYGSDWAKQEDM